MTARRANGRYPADCAPTSPPKAPRGIDDLGTRLDNMAVTRTTLLQQCKAAAYLYLKGEREVAQYLGLVEFYDRIVDVKEAEAIAALTGEN